MVILTIGCGISVLISSIVLFHNELERNLQEKINIAINVLEQTISDFKTNTYIAAFNMTGNPELISAVRSQDRDELSKAAERLSVLARLEIGTILDKYGNVLLRVHNPDIFGDNASDLPHIKSALNGEISVYIMEGPVLALAVAAGAPIYDENMNIAGAVTFAIRLDDQAFVNRMQALTGCEISIFNSRGRVATTLSAADSTIIANIELYRQINETVFAGNTFTTKL